MKNLLLASLLFVASSLALATPPPLPGVEDKILQLCNAVRVQEGLRPLTVSAPLRQAALSHSEDMMKSNYFAHKNPGNAADSLAARLLGAGLASLRWAENLYKCEGYTVDQLAKNAVDAWMASPTHRHNLLNPRYNRIGIGVCGEKGSYLFTQDFAAEAIEVLGYKVSPATDGYRVHLRARVCEGPRQGALLFNDKRIGSWEAGEDGQFEATVLLPAAGTLQIGQQVAPREWTVDTQIQVN